GSRREEVIDDEEDVGDVLVAVSIHVAALEGSRAGREEEVDEIEDIGDVDRSIAVRVARVRAAVALPEDVARRVSPLLPDDDEVARAVHGHAAEAGLDGRDRIHAERRPERSARAREAASVDRVVPGSR